MENNSRTIDTETKNLIESNESLEMALNTIGGLVHIATGIENIPEYVRLHLFTCAGEGIRNLVSAHLNRYFDRESIVGRVDLRVGPNVSLDVLAGELYEGPRRPGRNPLPASAWAENLSGIRDTVTSLKIY